jgi:hypothetical protein
MHFWFFNQNSKSYGIHKYTSYKKYAHINQSNIYKMFWQNAEFVMWCEVIHISV